MQAKINYEINNRNIFFVFNGYHFVFNQVKMNTSLLEMFDFKILRKSFRAPSKTSVSRYIANKTYYCNPELELEDYKLSFLNRQTIPTFYLFW